MSALYAHPCDASAEPVGPSVADLAEDDAGDCPAGVFGLWSGRAQR